MGKRRMSEKLIALVIIAIGIAIAVPLLYIHDVYIAPYEGSAQWWTWKIVATVAFISVATSSFREIRRGNPTTSQWKQVGGYILFLLYTGLIVWTVCDMLIMLAR